MDVRQTLARHLAGDGIEIGALNTPLDVRESRGIRRLRYVDRYPKAELLALFPELEPERSRIVETDVLCDVIHGLAPFADASLDFVVGCHLLEHVPDPIRLVREIWRVLRRGGRLFLAMPDKDYLAFDARRPLTPLAHVIDDHARAVRVVEDHHLDEFLRLAENVAIPADPAARNALFAQHRNRSIHVHVWNLGSFVEFLLFCGQTYAPFTVVDFSPPGRNERQEMLFVLERCVPGTMDPGAVRARLGS